MGRIDKDGSRKVRGRRRRRERRWWWW